ncbi:MAG TPA: glycine-rich domain-containing protein-like [Telluria sp.]|nr:glycine-rich domain-containing protein-like [Telluria sp.]
MDVGVWKRIEALNFDAIKRKLMDERSGRGWPQARADQAEQEYKRFLYLMQQFPAEILAPSADVDRFWHQHILDTMRYARDCDALFGYFLHHYPYLGLDGGGEPLREQVGQRTRTLYEQVFGNAGSASKDASATGTQASATAYCAAGAEPAYCAATAQQAFCAATASAVYCAAGVAATLDHAQPGVAPANSVRAQPALARAA